VWHTYNQGAFNPTVKATKGNIILNVNCPTIHVDTTEYILIADPNGPYKDYVNTQIMFDGSGSVGEIVRYVWDFGDGTTVESIVPYSYHTYDNKIGVFPVKLTVYDAKGHSAVGYTTATIIEPTNFKQDEDRVKEGLWVGKIIIVGKDGIQEVVRSNDEVKFNIELENDDEYDLDEARIIIEIPELGIKQKSTSFDLRTGQEKSQSITVPIWNAPQGWYEVKIIVQDDNVKRIKFRDIFVSNTYKKGCNDIYCGVY
jgi:PKD repeat protein